MEDKSNLAKLVTEYVPSRKALDLVSLVKVVFLVGISGAGKDTIKKEILKDPSYYDIISHTTRAPRKNSGQFEVDGEDYHFISEEKAKDMLINQEFIEAKFVHGTVYGTSVDEFEKSKNQSKIAITDIDVQGVSEYKKISQSTVAIFILTPTYEDWVKRLSKRYETKEDFMTEWPKRYKSAIDELNHALEVPYYHFVLNDSLEDAIDSVHKIAHKPDLFNRKDDEARLAARDLLEQIIEKADNID